MKLKSYAILMREKNLIQTFGKPCFPLLYTCNFYRFSSNLIPFWTLIVTVLTKRRLLMVLISFQGRIRTNPVNPTPLATGVLFLHGWKPMDVMMKSSWCPKML